MKGSLVTGGGFCRNLSSNQLYGTDFVASGGTVSSSSVANPVREKT